MMDKPYEKEGEKVKVRVLKTQKVVNAKRFKDMSVEEVENSTRNPSAWDGEDMFIEPPEKFSTCLRYMHDDEVEIISE